MSSIEWTDKTWNPVTGCTKVSEGCRICFAESVANRFWGDRKFSDVQFHPDRLEQPLRWKKPRMVFVNSMSDLFHKVVTDEQLDRIFAVMALTPQHIYQVLTKRPERMLEYCNSYTREQLRRSAVDLLDILQLRSPISNFPVDACPLPNVWLGVSVENQKAADDRIPLLLQTPAAVRFLSCEPLLGEVDLLRVKWFNTDHRVDVLRGGYWEDREVFWKGFVNHSDMPSTIDWVIIGGESGADARPCHLEWLRSIAQQCKSADVPVFVKQLGSDFHTQEFDVAAHQMSSHFPKKLKDKKGGDMAEFPVDLQVREFPKSVEAIDAAVKISN